MYDQSQTLRWINQETLGDQTQGNELNWTDGLCSIRDNFRSYWGSKPRKIMGSHYICGPLLQLLLHPPHEGKLIWGNSPGKGVLQSLVSQLWGQGLRLKGRYWKVWRAPIRGGSPNMQTKDYILQGGLSPPKRNCWAQDQGIDPRQLGPLPSRHQIVAESSDYHVLTLLRKSNVTEIQQPGNGWGQKDAREEGFWRGVSKFPYRLPHLGLPIICTRTPTAGRAGRATQIGTKGNNQSISWTIPISLRVSGPSIKHQNWECFPPVPYGIWLHIIHCDTHEEGNSPRKLEKPDRWSLRACYAGKLHSFKIVAS